MARRGPYNLDRVTKLLESHKQFPGGLKTVDSDDALGSFFLRDSENISLSEYGFLERRYGLVDDANFELPLVGLEEGNEEDGFKDRLQGYFEYVLPNGVVETIIFVNGRLYLNGVQVRQLYQYPRDTFAKFGPTIDEDRFRTYVEDTYGIDFTSFDSIDKLFDTGRSVEATIIDKKMYFFTGVYPIVYEGTGEFYLLPEYIPTFRDLFLAGHNVFTSDFERIYSGGVPLAPFTPDMTEQTITAFSDIGYKPLFPYNINPPELPAGDPGRGFHIDVQFALPPLPTVANQSVFGVDFKGYTRKNFPAETVTSGGVLQYGTGLYLDFFPEVYTRPSGSPQDERLWQQVEDENLEYTVLDNYDSATTRSSVLFRKEYDAILEDGLAASRAGIFDRPLPSFIRLARIRAGQRLKDFTGPYSLVIKNLPVGYNDYRIVYKIRKSGWRVTPLRTDVTVPDQEPAEEFFEEIVTEKEYILTDVFATEEKTNDYLRIRPEALWTCNKVLNHFGKLVAYGSTVEPQRVFISAPQRQNREYFPFSFSQDFETDNAEPIQKIVPFMNILVILAESFTWGLAGTDALLGSENLYRSFTISPLYGTIAPKSVRPVRNQLFFLSKEGIVSLQSLYAIDEQYNVKKIDANIENIVPLDPESVAIQYDDQYWIHFPNTPNKITLRYDIDKRAWVKDTYFEYNGLDSNARPQLSNTVFNGVHKYLREADRLILVTNPMQVGGSGNYSVRKLHVDFTVATDLWETPRTLFETSFLNQGYPFHEKKYMEKKYEFTIQNEYHLGKEPIYFDRDMSMPGTTEIYTASEVPLVKNHEYKVNVPDANIQGYNIRLFDIQGNPIKTIQVRDNTPPQPSAFNFLVSQNSVRFNLVNNDVFQNDIIYQLNDREDFPFFGSAQQVFPGADNSREVTVTDLPFGLNKLVLRARRSFQAQPSDSIRRVIYFQVPDGVYDETGPELTPPPASLRPLNFTVIPKDTTGDNKADAFDLSWTDQNINPASELFRYSYQNLTQVGLQFFEPTTTNTTAEITGLGAFEGDRFRITVEARLNGVFSPAAELEIDLTLPVGLPGVVNVNTLQGTFPFSTSESLLAQWTDVENETGYRIFWKYRKDDIDPDVYDNYYETQRQNISQNSTSFTFRTTPPSGPTDQRPFIFPNAVIDFNIWPFNQNGLAPSATSRQMVVPKNYNPAQFIITPINGESGVRIEIPEAKKQMPTRSGNLSGPIQNVETVFEDQWEIQYKVKGASVFPTANTIFLDTNDSNVIELTNTVLTAQGKPLLQPNTDYEFRLRPRHFVKNPVTGVDALFASAVFLGSLRTHTGAFNQGYGATFEAKTGTDTPPVALAPTITNVVSGTNSITFRFFNNDSETVDVYYLVSTSSGARVSEGTFTNIRSDLSPGTSTGNITVPSLNSNTTYYITAGAKNATKSFSTNADIDSRKVSVLTLQPTTTIVASFNTDGGTPASYTSFSTTGSSLSVTSPGSPTKSGFVFTGWNPSLPRTITTSTQFVAQWVAESPTLPAAPSSVSISSPADNQVSFSWPAVSGATSYQWELYLGGAFLEGSSTTNLSVFRTGIPAGQIQARVRACNANGCGAQRNSATITVEGSGLA